LSADFWVASSNATTMALAESYAETARKASAGTWRKPRMKIYDYNQVSKCNWHCI
jgi:hypothetical protein